MSITVAQVKQAKSKDQPYKLTDSKSLYLLIHPNGSKYWRMDYRFEGKRKTFAIGVYPEISLASARDSRDEARLKIRDGTDPSSERRIKKATKEGAVDFRSVALDWFEKKMTDKSDRHRQRTMSIFTRDLFPKLGHRPIHEIAATELLAAIRKIEDRNALEIAHRARTIAGQVFRYGIAAGLCERDVSADLKGALRDKPPTKHRAAITEPEELSHLIVAINGYQGTPVVCAALRLSALLFQRPGEIRHMEWAEIDWGKERWCIPGRKMKEKRDHIVPLSKQALVVLKDIHALTGRGVYVFPSQRGPSRPLSDNGVRTALRTMGFDNETMDAHGFRATARTILDEVLNFRVDYIEHQLSHAVKDPTGRAYNRTKYLPERVEMMQAWADYLDNLGDKGAMNDG